MKLKYQEIEIRMQQGASMVKLRVPAWETPVLQSMHEEVTILRDVCEERDAPSVSAEMGRLKVAYGAERKEGGFTGIPYVEGVYGQNQAGVQALKQAMQSCVMPKDSIVTPYALPPELRQDLLQALSEGGDELSDLIGENADEDESLEA
jgi:hypothetical protein